MPKTTPVEDDQPPSNATADDVVGRDSQKPPRPSTAKVAYSTPEFSRLQRTRRCIEQRVFESTWYNLLMATLNIGNCILIGVETDCRAAADPAGYCSTEVELIILIFQYVFVVGITIDLVMQILVDWGYILTPWGIFDTILVLASLFNAIVIQPLFLAVPHAEVLSKTTGLRILRLLRLTRSVASFLRLREINVVIAGLFGAMKSIIWIIAIGTLITYTFAVLGVESFASADPSWSRVGETMVTLLQIATLDMWTSASQPVWHEYPVIGHIFVMIYLIIVALTLMSLIVATLTERTIAKSKEDSFVQDIGRLREHFRHSCSYVDMTKHEFEEMWKDSKAQAHLKNYGTLDELKELFDLLAGADVSSGTVNLEMLSSFISLYGRDKATCLSMLTLQQLRTLRRHVLGMEHSMEASNARQLEILSAAGSRCAEVATQIKEEHEISKCRLDHLREKRLGRQGICELDVTKLRHVFEAADSTRRGELDFIDFSSLFPRTVSKAVLDMWNSVATSDSGTIDFDEFICIIGGFGAKKFFRNAAVQSMPRRLCTPTEAGEDITHLATKVADAALDRVVNCAIEEAAKHAAKCVAERALESIPTNQEPKQVTEDIVDHVVQNVTAQISDRLSQHVADCSVVGKQIAEELQESVSSFHRSLQEQANKLGGNRIPSKSSDEGAPAVGHREVMPVSPQTAADAKDNVGSAVPFTIPLEKARPPPLVFDETPASRLDRSVVDSAPTIPASNSFGMFGFAAPSRHSYQRLPEAQSPYASALGSVNQALSVESVLRGSAATPQQEVRGHPYTPSIVQSAIGAPPGSLEGAFNAGTVATRIAATIVQSPLAPSSRPCLLTRMEHLANQMDELNQDYDS